MTPFLVLSLFVEMTKFKSYLSSYHPMQKASNWKSGLDMERWLTPWRTSTHKRPFTQEGNYLVRVVISQLALLSVVRSNPPTPNDIIAMVRNDHNGTIVAVYYERSDVTEYSISSMELFQNHHVHHQHYLAITTYVHQQHHQCNMHSLYYC